MCVMGGGVTKQNQNNKNDNQSHPQIEQKDTKTLSVLTLSGMK